MRLIDADCVIEFYKKQAKDGGFYAPIYEGVCNIIERFPTISAVPVVRCRECKSYDHGCCVVKRYRGDDSIITMPPGGYCSYGQRKEVDHD